MSARMLLLTVLCASGLATAQSDGGPRKGTVDAGTKGTTVPDRPAPPRSEMPAPRTQTTTPVGTGSETPPPPRTTEPTTPAPRPDLPSTTQPPRPTPH
jgi:hypothetical protein